MSIPEYHFYHGAALSVLVSSQPFTGLTRITDISSAYAVNNMIGLYVKRATNEDSPWQFTFTEDHQSEIRRLFQRFGEKSFVALVCHHTGICLLSYGEYRNVVEEDFTKQRTVIVRRPGAGGFRVSGHGGNHSGVVPLNRYPDGLFA